MRLKSKNVRWTVKTNFKHFIGIALLIILVLGVVYYAKARFDGSARSESDRSAAIEAVLDTYPNSKNSDLSVPFWNPVDAETSEVEVRDKTKPKIAYRILVHWNSKTKLSQASIVDIVDPK